MSTWLPISETVPVGPATHLYRSDPWIELFMVGLRHEAEVISQPVADDAGISLSLSRRAPLAIGIQDNRLETIDATYLDALLFHPGLHPGIAEALEEAIRRAAGECARRAMRQADYLLDGGRTALLDHPEWILSTTVLERLASIGQVVPRPVGVSGLLTIDAGFQQWTLVAHRSGAVAVNPDCLTTPIDGGISPGSCTIEDLVDDLGREAHEEFDLSAGGRTVTWEFRGLFVPPPHEQGLHGKRVFRSGVNFMFVGTLALGADEAHRMVAEIPRHFETATVFCLSSPLSTDQAVVAALDPDHSARAHTLSVAEHLASAIIECDLAQIAFGPITESETQLHITPGPQEVRTMPIEARDTIVYRLEDIFAAELLLGYPRLRESLDREEMRDVAENRDIVEPSIRTYEMLLDVVIEYLLVSENAHYGDEDASRIFEAVVYQLGGNFFGNKEDMASHYFDQSDDFDFPTIIAGIIDTKLERLDASEKLLQADLVNLKEGAKARGYSNVKRMAELYCFCCDIWSMEARRDPGAADKALDVKFKEAFARDPLALFFKARALLLSPVPSIAHIQLGFHFVSTSLTSFPHNAGMHHNKALFLLRKANASESSGDGMERNLELAHEAASEALLWDAEFPTFYATRAKINRRRGQISDATVDLKTAIELSRYDKTSQGGRSDLDEWTALLETWEIEPTR